MLGPPPDLPQPGLEEAVIPQVPGEGSPQHGTRGSHGPGTHAHRGGPAFRSKPAHASFRSDSDRTP